MNEACVLIRRLRYAYRARRDVPVAEHDTKPPHERDLQLLLGSLVGHIKQCDGAL